MRENNQLNGTVPHLEGVGRVGPLQMAPQRDLRLGKREEGSIDPISMTSNSK